MSDQIPSAEQSAAFEEAIAYLDSLPLGELERRIAAQDTPENSAAERWAGMSPESFGRIPSGWSRTQTRVRMPRAEVAESTITDGTWTVGMDIAPRTYRSDGASSDCCWAITKTGSNGADIIENDLPSGGRPAKSHWRKATTSLPPAVDRGRW